MAERCTFPSLPALDILPRLPVEAGALDDVADDSHHRTAHHTLAMATSQKQHNLAHTGHLFPHTERLE